MSAFVGTPTLNLSSFRHANVRRQASSVRAITWSTAAPRNARIIVTGCTQQPRSDASVEDADSSPGSGPSKSLFGRLLVEVLSLLVGAALICMVVIWRASQSVARASLRALLWLSNVRQLGKWAMRRLTGLNSTAVPVTSFREAIGRAYGLTLKSLVTLGRKSEHMTAVETPARQANESDIGTDDFIDSSVRAAVTDSNSVVETASGRRLILVRHAKTTWDRDNDTPDHDRVLSPQGKEEARLVGSELSRISWTPDTILCSDAVRTVQTLSLLNMPEDHTDATICTESLYYAVTGDEMAVAVDDTLGTKGFTNDTTLMVVCHNPGCEELVERLTGHRTQMGTACAALIKYVGNGDAPAEGNTDNFLLSSQETSWVLVDLIRPSALHR